MHYYFVYVKRKSSHFWLLGVGKTGLSVVVFGVSSPLIGVVLCRDGSNLIGFLVGFFGELQGGDDAGDHVLVPEHSMTSCLDCANDAGVPIRWDGGPQEQWADNETKFIARCIFDRGDDREVKRFSVKHDVLLKSCVM